MYKKLVVVKELCIYIMYIIMVSNCILPMAERKKIIIDLLYTSPYLLNDYLMSKADREKIIVDLPDTSKYINLIK